MWRSCLKSYIKRWLCSRAAGRRWWLKKQMGRWLVEFLAWNFKSAPRFLAKCLQIRRVTGDGFLMHLEFSCYSSKHILGWHVEILIFCDGDLVVTHQHFWDDFLPDLHILHVSSHMRWWNYSGATCTDQSQGRWWSLLAWLGRMEFLNTLNMGTHVESIHYPCEWYNDIYNYIYIYI